LAKRKSAVEKEKKEEGFGPTNSLAREEIVRGPFPESVPLQSRRTSIRRGKKGKEKKS